MLGAGSRGIVRICADLFCCDSQRGVNMALRSTGRCAPSRKTQENVWKYAGKYAKSTPGKPKPVAYNLWSILTDSRSGFAAHCAVMQPFLHVAHQ